MFVFRPGGWPFKELTISTIGWSLEEVDGRQRHKRSQSAPFMEQVAHLELSMVMRLASRLATLPVGSGIRLEPSCKATRGSKHPMLGIKKLTE